MDWTALLYWSIVAILMMVVVTFAVTLVIVIRIFLDVRRDRSEAGERLRRMRRHL